jgi:hypothetical protein
MPSKAFQRPSVNRPSPKPKAPQPDPDNSDRPSQQTPETSQSEHPDTVTKRDSVKPRSDGKPKATFQSIAVFHGRMHIEGDRLLFRCSDGVLLQVAGIDSRFTLWLLSRPGELFSPADRPWLVYPKSDRKGRLTVVLKSLCTDDRLPMPIDTVKIVGKILAIDGELMTIGIRRNLSSTTYKELASKRMIQPCGLDQFVVQVWGQPPSESGAIVQLDCRRDGDRLSIV